MTVELTTVTFVAEKPPKVTLVAPKKLVPLMVTGVPPRVVALVRTDAADRRRLREGRARCQLREAECDQQHDQAPQVAGKAPCCPSRRTVRPTSSHDPLAPVQRDRLIPEEFRLAVARFLLLAAHQFPVPPAVF